MIWGKTSEALAIAKKTAIEAIIDKHPHVNRDVMDLLTKHLEAKD